MHFYCITEAILCFLSIIYSNLSHRSSNLRTSPNDFYKIFFHPLHKSSSPPYFPYKADKTIFTYLIQKHEIFSHRAVETLRVVVVIESLHPAITSLDWEATRDALGGEELIPVLFTIWETILQVEWRVCKDLATVSTAEALWMEVCAHRLQTVLEREELLQ